jgi:nitroreductase
VANAVFEGARTMLSLRDYKAKPVPDDVVMRIVEAGRQTASGMNTQPWHFVVVRDREGLRALGSMVQTGPYIVKAAFAIVVAYEKDSPLAIADTSRAIQSMMLTAWGDGVGSNWTGFSGRLAAVRDHVGLPDRYEVLAVIPFGYPARPVKGVKKRKPLGQVASAERFGTPLS